jgi:hypothetical protein
MSMETELEEVGGMGEAEPRVAVWDSLRSWRVETGKGWEDQVQVQQVQQGQHGGGREGLLPEVKTGKAKSWQKVKKWKS